MKEKEHQMKIEELLMEKEMLQLKLSLKEQGQCIPWLCLSLMTIVMMVGMMMMILTMKMMMAMRINDDDEDGEYDIDHDFLMIIYS